MCEVKSQYDSGAEITSSQQALTHSQAVMLLAHYTVNCSAVVIWRPFLVCCVHLVGELAQCDLTTSVALLL